MKINLAWSKSESFAEYQKLLFPDDPGLYLHIVSLNGFHRITYVGEAKCLRTRLNSYYVAYKSDNDNEYHCIDLSKMKGDPYDIYSDAKGNTVSRLLQDKIYFRPKTQGKNCTMEYLQLRRTYFKESYVSYCTCEELKNDKVRKSVQCNIQWYVVQFFKNLKDGNGHFVGLTNFERNNINNELVIDNQYDDFRLQMVPLRIDYSRI